MPPVRLAGNAVLSFMTKFSSGYWNIFDPTNGYTAIHANIVRILPLEKHNEIVPAHADFQMTISYNPGYQSAVKDLKESTKQRFLAIDFDYPTAAIEAKIIARESGADAALSATLVSIGERSRNLQGHGLDEGASTRMLIHAGRLVRAGLPLQAAVRSSIILPITDNSDIREALSAAIEACLP